MLTIKLNNYISTEIIAHRGASKIAPENTLTSVRLAWELKADTVEIDVHLTQDKRVVVIHDTSTKRTTTGNLTISETLSTELRKLDAGILKSKKFSGQKIPFLEEIISTIPQNRRLFIEIKCGEEIIQFIKKIIIESGKLSQTALIGFNLETISLAKKFIPEIPAYWLIKTARNRFTRKTIPYNQDIILLIKEKNLDGVCVHYNGMTEEFAEKIISSGLKLYVWTVNSLDEAIRLLKYRVHGIITDRPGWLLNNLNDRYK